MSDKENAIARLEVLRQKMIADKYVNPHDVMDELDAIEADGVEIPAEFSDWIIQLANR